MWERIIPKRFGDLDLPHARDNWKLLLTDALTDVLNVFDPDQKVLLIWDEFPLMIYNIREREGADSAIQLLDVLRHLRQTHAKQLRFLFTGSVGLHLVLRSLRAHGNANAPTNDMHSETVPPMSDTDTRELATRLLCRLDPLPADHHAAANRIVEAVGGFPYFVQHVVDQLSLLSRPATPADVDEAVRDLILSDHDTANLAYNVARIGTYYNAQEAQIALAVLDAVASQADVVPIANLTNLVRHKSPAVTEDAVRAICLLLRQDHYLTLDRKGSYSFRFRILRQWWMENRL